MGESVSGRVGDGWGTGAAMAHMYTQLVVGLTFEVSNGVA